MDSGAMIDRCFRHQHPEAYGEIEIAEPPLPMAAIRAGQIPGPLPGVFARGRAGLPGHHPAGALLNRRRALELGPRVYDSPAP